MEIGIVVFMLFAAIAAPAQTFTTLVSFDKTDGANPYTGLVQGRDGNYYGMTTNGGINSPACYGAGCGTIFKITPAGTLTTIYTQLERFFTAKIARIEAPASEDAGKTMAGKVHPFQPVE